MMDGPESLFAGVNECGESGMSQGAGAAARSHVIGRDTLGLTDNILHVCTLFLTGLL